MSKFEQKLSKIILIMVIPVLFICFTAFSTEGTLNIKHNGKSNFSINVESSDNQADFEKHVDEKVFGYNSVSGDSDIVTVNNIEKIDGGYTISGKLRRIDKVMINGDFEYKKISEYLAIGSEGRALIKKWSNGSLSCTVSAFYDNRLGQITIPKGKVKAIKPYSVKENRNVSVDDLYNYAEKNKKEQLIVYRVLDVKNVTKVTVELPGEVKFYGGDNVKVVDGNKLEITPFSMKAQILRNKSDVDENGNTIVKPDVTVEEINGFMGYVVYKKTMSPVAIVFISLICAIVVGLLVWFYIAMVRRGKKLENDCSGENNGKVSK